MNKGIDVNSVDKFQQTPIHVASQRNKNPEVIRTLINLGANINAVDLDKKSPFHFAARWSKNI